MYVCMYVRTYVCMYYVCMYVCMYYVCMHVYIYVQYRKNEFLFTELLRKE